MAKVAKLGMRKQVYNIIKDRILSQEYGFGDTINITELCSELEVSNTPVREALSLLEMEGLVSSSLNSKVKVFKLTSNLFDQITQAFFAIETGSYNLCRTNGYESKLKKLMENAILNQKKQFKLDSNSTAYIHTAIEFDRCFALATGNEYLLQTYDRMSSMLFLQTKYLYQQNNVNKDENIIQHEAILKAVNEEDPDAVFAALTIHYDKHISL